MKKGLEALCLFEFFSLLMLFPIIIVGAYNIGSEYRYTDMDREIYAIYFIFLDILLFCALTTALSPSNYNSENNGKSVSLALREKTRRCDDVFVSS